MEKVLQLVVEAVLKVNAKNHYLDAQTLVILVSGYVKWDRPLSSKVGSNKAMDTPTKVHDIQKFVVIVNCYRYMWHRHAHTIYPLSKL